MSTRRSTGSTRGPETPTAKKAPAKRARASRTPEGQPQNQTQSQPESHKEKQEERQVMLQDVTQELSVAAAAAALMTREPTPVVPRPQVAPPPPSPRIEISPDARRAMVAEAAYLRAERRGFAHGGEVEDWLAAEAEVDQLLQGAHGSRPQ